MNIFEELMSKHQTFSDESLAESVRKKSMKIEAKKIDYKKIRVESRQLIEDANEDDLKKIDQDFATEIKDDEETKEDEVVLIIDPEIPYGEEVPEDAEKNLIGDYVYKCSICGANYACNCDAEKNEAVEVDEDGIPVECPICGADEDQVLVGQIAPADEVEDKDEGEMEPVDVDDAEDNEEGVEEFEESEEDEVIEDSLKRKPLPRRRIKTESKKVVKESADRKVSAICAYLSSLGDHFAADLVGGGSVFSIWQDLLPASDWKNFKISDWEGATIDEIREKIEDSSSRWYLSDDAKVTFSDDGVSFRNPRGYSVKIYPHRSSKTESKKSDVCPECGKDPCECDKKDEGCGKKSLRKKVKEDIEDDEEVDVNLDLEEPATPPVEVEVEKEEPKVEVNADKVEIVLDDVRFNKLMNKMIKENYKGNPQFKLTKITSKDQKLTLEYNVAKVKGKFVAEGFSRDARVMKLRMRDQGAFTESFTKAPSFVVECVRIRNKIVPTKVSYNFTKKVNESLYRVKGEVKNSK